jgi:hypothetical protein
VKDNEERGSRKTTSKEWESFERFSQKQKADSRVFSSRSRSRSRSYDLSLNSKRRNLFNQSFDSKLSEFSDNGEMMVLHRPTKIKEYFEDSKESKYNSLGKNLNQIQSNQKFNSNEKLFSKEEEDLPVKNFTFSKNKGGKRSLVFDNDINPKSQTKKKSTKLRKMEIMVESPNGEEECKFEKSLSEEEFELTLPNVINKKPKFELDLGLDDDEEEEHIKMKPPSLGGHKRFNMAGSSWGNIGFSLGTGQQKVLNAPRNNKKVKFTFGSEILKQNLRENFKLPNQKNKFQPNLEIIIPEENSKDMDYDSDEPTLELPSLRDRKSRKSTNNKRFNLGIQIDKGEMQFQEPTDKVILVDEFDDSVSKGSDEHHSPPVIERRNLIIEQDHTKSNSPRHVSGMNESLKSSSDKAHWNIQPTKNLEIQFDSELINKTMGNRGADLFAGCRTNPLPTTKNATQKYKGFDFGGGRKKKRHLTVSLTGEEMFVKSSNAKKNECIDEVSNEEIKSNSGEEQGRSPGKPIKKRNLKMKINSKNSEYTNKNFSKQSSQVINSIQSKYFI